MSKIKPGTIVKIIPNIIPKWMADCEAVVVSWEYFQQAELADNPTYHWKLSEIRDATFIMLLNGKRAGKVTMAGKQDFVKP